MKTDIQRNEYTPHHRCYERAEPCLQSPQPGLPLVTEFYFWHSHSCPWQGKSVFSMPACLGIMKNHPHNNIVEKQRPRAHSTFPKVLWSQLEALVCSVWSMSCISDGTYGKRNGPNHTAGKTQTWCLGTWKMFRFLYFQLSLPET